MGACGIYKGGAFIDSLEFLDLTEDIFSRCSSPFLRSFSFGSRSNEFNLAVGVILHFFNEDHVSCTHAVSTNDIISQMSPSSRCCAVPPRACILITIRRWRILKWTQVGDVLHFCLFDRFRTKRDRRLKNEAKVRRGPQKKAKKRWDTKVSQRISHR